jgi:hypothetical protein
VWWVTGQLPLSPLFCPESLPAKSAFGLLSRADWRPGIVLVLGTSAQREFDNLGVEPAIWRKLQEQLVPIREPYTFEC